MGRVDVSDSRTDADVDAPPDTEPRPDPGRHRPWLALVGVVLTSRALYWWAGVRFDARFGDSAMQMLDRDILAADPLGAAWYLHIQPPLFNLAAGIVFRIFGDSSAGAFHLLYLALTCALAVNLFELLRGFRVPDPVAFVLTAVLVVSPSVVQYENLLFYPHLELVLLVVAARALQRYAGAPAATRGRPLLLFSACLTALALSRSLYHPLWLAGLAVVVLLVAGRADRRRLALAVAVPLVAVVAVSAKNQALFGWFTTSSLEGNSLWRMTALQLTAEEFDELVADGTISEASRPTIALCRSALDRHPDEGPPVREPALDRFFREPERSLVNLNHRAVVACERQLRDESLAIIRARPHVYLRALRAGFAVRAYPVTPDVRIRPGNQDALRGPGRVEAALLGAPAGAADPFDPEFGSWSPGRIEWVVVVATPLALGGLALLVIRGRRAAGVDPLAAAFILYVLASSAVLTQLLESGENNRFRFVTDPLLLAGCAAVVAAWRRRESAGAEPP